MLIGRALVQFEPFRSECGDPTAAKTAPAHLDLAIASMVLVPAVSSSFHVFHNDLIVIKLVHMKVVLLGFYRQVSRVRVHDLACMMGVYSLVSG